MNRPRILLLLCAFGLGCGRRPAAPGLDPSGGATMTPTAILPGATPRSLQLKARYWGIHIGQGMGFRVRDLSQPATVVNAYIPNVIYAYFSVYIPAVLYDGHSYRLDYFGDDNNNGTYEPYPGDHDYQVTEPAVLGDQAWLMDHGLPFSPLGSFNTASRIPSGRYDYSLNILDISPHVGQTLGFRLRDSGNMNVEALLKFVIPTAQYQILVLNSMTSGQSYQADFFADVNSDGLYQAPPSDHAWRLSYGPVGGNVSDSWSHNFTFTNIGPFILP